MRVQSEKTNDCPELRAGTFSRLTLHWIGHYLGLGSTIEEKSLPEILESREAENVLKAFNQNWQKELKKKKPSITRAGWATSKWELIMCATISIVASIINFASMSFIGALIDWFGDNEVQGLSL